MLAAVTEIVCAHSPDSDDAYMFYALATRKVRSPLLTFRHVLEDIQTIPAAASLTTSGRKSTVDPLWTVCMTSAAAARGTVTR